MEGKLEVDVEVVTIVEDTCRDVIVGASVVKALVVKASHCLGFLQLFTKSIVLICSALHSPNSKSKQYWIIDIIIF